MFSEYFRLNPRYLIMELPIGRNTQSERRLTAECEFVKANSTIQFRIDKSDEILAQFELIKKKTV